MNPENNIEGQSEKGESIHLEDLRQLANFYMFQNKETAEKAKSKTVADSHEKIAAQMETNSAMLENFASEGIVGVEQALQYIEDAMQTEKSAEGKNNLMNLQKFIESHKSKLPANFLKEREKLEKEMGQ